MRILAIGDIHTKKWIIDLVESVIDYYDGVIFCGDYADNWGAPATESIATWQRLHKLALDYPDKFLAVRGNHDYIYTENTPTKQSGYDYITQLMINDPTNKLLKDWLRSLPLLLEVDGVTYSHAGIDDSWDGSQELDSMWQDNSPIWVRPDWANYKNIPQVVGHTPQKTVTEVQPSIWLIDTFSQYHGGEPIGDGTMLEVTNGQTFQKIKINDSNDNSSSIKDRIS